MASDYKAMATAEAIKQGAPVNLVLATLEAENNFVNGLGDGGDSLGFGQVQPRFHMDNYKATAKEFGIALPSDAEGLKKLVLGNDAFSIALAVNTINEGWKATEGDWVAFTKWYVGTGISNADLKRREGIWNKYSNNSSDSSMILSSNTKNIGIYAGLGIIGFILLWVLSD